MNTDELLSKKLIIVTGKGGVGKTAVSLALSYLNARHGRSPVFVTLKEVRRGSYFFGFDTGIDSSESILEKGINAVYIDPNLALKEYIRERFVSLYPVYAAILKSKTLQTFFEAAPGLKELITIGKVWHLGTGGGRRGNSGPEYDQVIFDAPSTGHAIPVLDLPSRVLQMVRSGAFKSHIEWVDGFLKDPGKTAVVVVSAPEEMVVGETLELIDAVQSLGISVLFTVVNKVYENPFSLDEEKIIQEHNDRKESPGSARVFGLAKDHIDRAKISDKYIEKVRKRLDDRVLVIRKIYKKDLTTDDLNTIASGLDTQLSGIR
ncbi:MAG: ArsA family ATPase [Thermodesulfobacteriota bacterium]